MKDLDFRRFSQLAHDPIVSGSSSSSSDPPPNPPPNRGEARRQNTKWFQLFIYGPLSSISYISILLWHDMWHSPSMKRSASASKASSNWQLRVIGPARSPPGALQPPLPRVMDGDHALRSSCWILPFPLSIQTCASPVKKMFFVTVCNMPQIRLLL